MRLFTYCIQDELGIHARTAGELAVLAEDCNSEIVIDNGLRRENVKQLMAVLGMGVKKGQTVTVMVEGGDEETTVERIKDFFHNSL